MTSGASSDTTVLVVDDEADLRNLVQFKLTEAGFRVVAVATGFVRQLLGPAHAVLASIILGR